MNSDSPATQSQESPSKVSGQQGRWIDIAFGIALLGLTPLLFVQFQALLDKPFYQFAPFAWLAFVFFVYRRAARSELNSVVRTRFVWGLSIVAGVLSVLAAAGFLPWLAQLAAIILVQAWLLARLGSTPWYQTTGWCSLLLITLPLPGGLDRQWLRQFQGWIASSTSGVTDLVGIPHLNTGVVFELREGRLLIDEVYGGWDSMYAMAAITLLLLVATRTNLAVSVLTLLSVPVWAWGIGAAKLLTTIVLLERFSINIVFGWRVIALDLLALLLATGLIWLTQRVVSVLLTPFPVVTVSSNEWHAIFNYAVCWPAADPTRHRGREESGYQPETLQASSGHLAPLPTRWLVSVLALSGVITAAGAAYGFAGGRSPTMDIVLPPSVVADRFPVDTLPRQLFGLQLVDYSQSYRNRINVDSAEHSVRWFYSDEDRRVAITLEFPFSRFHRLEHEYLGAGRELVDDRAMIDLAAPASPQSLGAESVGGDERQASAFEPQAGNRDDTNDSSGDIASSGSAGEDATTTRSQQAPQASGSNSLTRADSFPPDIPTRLHEVELFDPVFGESYLCYSQFDLAGRELVPVESHRLGSLPMRLLHALQLQPVSFQVQLFIEGTGGLSEPERQKYRRVALEAVQHLLPIIRELPDAEA